MLFPLGLLLLCITTTTAQVCDMTAGQHATITEATLAPLKKAGWTVKEGHFRVYNSTKFGANPGNPYVVYEWGVLGGRVPVFKLDSRAGLLSISCTPHGVEYFGYRSYLMTEGTSLVFASLGDTLNNLVINTTGASSDDVYGRTAAVVTTGDAQTWASISAALQAAGLGEATNLDSYDPTIIPQSRLSVANRFIFLHRGSVWSSAQEKQAYFEQDRAVYMLLPPSATKPVALPPVPVRHRGTGVEEASLIPDFNSSMSALAAGVSDHFAKTSSLALVNSSVFANRPLYGLECIANRTNCLGDNHDTNYIHDPRQPLLAEKDVYVFIGANCVATGKCTYANFGLYKDQLTSTPLTINCSRWVGSAQFYAPALPEAAAEKLFAFAIARDCGSGNPFCLNVSSAVVQPTEPWFAIVRTVLEQQTKTGPLASELVLPRSLHFSPQHNGTGGYKV